MKFELKMALRFLKSGKGQTLFILMGISVGVAVQIFLGTLITSLQENLVDATVGNAAHITIKNETTSIEQGPGLVFNIEGNFSNKEKNLNNWELLVDYLSTQSDLTAVSPVVSGSAFIVKSGLRSPLVIKGIDSTRANQIYNFDQAVVQGGYELTGNSVLIGQELAENYALNVGDSFPVELTSGTSELFIIKGLFDLGSAPINESYVFLDLNRAQKLFELGGNVSAIELQVNDVFAADQIANKLNQQLLGINASNWKEDNASLLSALTSQSSSSYTIQFFVLMAVTLGIASVLAVSVVQKQRQIGILKAMGASGKATRNIFILQGAILGFMGALLGALVGYLLIQGFLFGTSLATGTPLFPLTIRLNQMMVILIITTLASILSSIGPARNSARLNPIDVMKG